MENKQKEGGQGGAGGVGGESRKQKNMATSPRVREVAPTSLPKVMHYLSNLEGEQKHQGELKQLNNIGINFRVA